MSYSAVVAFVLVCGGVWLLACGFGAGFLWGLRKGRELERMEPPRRGVSHFRDGRMSEVQADSPLEALAIISEQPT